MSDQSWRVVRFIVAGFLAAWLLSPVVGWDVALRGYAAACLLYSAALPKGCAVRGAFESKTLEVPDDVAALMKACRNCRHWQGEPSDLEMVAWRCEIDGRHHGQNDGKDCVFYKYRGGEG